MKLVYRVMLADDNKFALEYFSQLVDWKKQGFELVNMSIDGVEAWNNFCHYEPDVVITDVEMPGIDGIELTEKIRAFRPETIIVFLSSYDEFDYARAAIDLNVKDYILKQELDAASLEKKLKEIFETLQIKENKNKKVFTGYLQGCFQMASGEIDRELYQEVFQKNCGVFFIEQDHIPCELREILKKETQEADSGKIISILENTVSEVEYTIHIKKYRWLCLCRKNTSLEQNAYKVQSQLQFLKPLQFSSIVFGKMNDIIQLRERYDSSEFAFQQRYFEGSEVCIFADLSEQPNSVSVSGKEKIRRELENGNLEGRLLDQMFRPLFIRCDYQTFIYEIQEIACVLEQKANELALDWKMDCLESTDLVTASQIVQWMKKKIAEFSEKKENAGECSSEVIKGVIRYIYHEYQNAFLSVEEIAENAGISVNHLNDLFKKEQGETVGKFLTRIRMERAREILNGGEKMSVVAEKTGYTSTSYFARVFRKYYGVSPQEYKVGIRK